MKKVLSLLLALCLSISLAAPALAASNSMENFKKITVYENQFQDVSPTHWSTPSIRTCYEYGLMNGVSTTIFRPDGSLTVAQAIVMADRVHEIYTTGKSTLTSGGKPWYTPYIQYALKHGIVKKNEFPNYDAAVNRAQMAYIFGNALPDAVMGQINQVDYLPDVNSKTPYAASIFKLYEAGILTGNDAFGTFRPARSIKRSEAAAIISRVAIPAHRQSIILLQKFNWNKWEHLTLAVPQDAKVQSTGDNVYSLMSERQDAGAVLTLDRNNAYKGFGIDILGPRDMDQILLQSFADTKLSLTQNSQLVTFGKIKAYRTQGTMKFDDQFMDCVIYAYIYDDTMVITSLMGPHGHKVLKNMANNVTISGQAVRPLIK